MTQHPVFVGLEMTFVPIGFTTALILNRLRNQQRVEEARRADDESRRDQDAAEQAVRAELKRVNKRLDLLRSRVEPSRTGRESAD
jgi:hypothetical protein